MYFMIPFTDKEGCVFSTFHGRVVGNNFINAL